MLYASVGYRALVYMFSTLSNCVWLFLLQIANLHVLYTIKYFARVQFSDRWFTRVVYLLTSLFLNLHIVNVHTLYAKHVVQVYHLENIFLHASYTINHVRLYHLQFVSVHVLCAINYFASVPPEYH